MSTSLDLDYDLQHFELNLTKSDKKTQHKPNKSLAKLDQLNNHLRWIYIKLGLGIPPSTRKSAFNDSSAREATLFSPKPNYSICSDLVKQTQIW